MNILTTAKQLIRTAILLVVSGVTAPTMAQTPLSPDEAAMNAHMALQAHDKFLETWNTRDPSVWSSSLNFPHVRPSAGMCRLSETAAEYESGVDFESTLATGWRYTRWHSREILQIGKDKVHVAGRWVRFDAEDNPILSSYVTYVVTRQGDHWGLQSRFGVGLIRDEGDITTAMRNSAREAVAAFMEAWNSNDAESLAAALHFPHVRIADNRLDYWESAEDYLSGTEIGRQRTWAETRIERSDVVQASSSAANVTLLYSRLSTQGEVLAQYEALFFVVRRNGEWKIQARSSMGP